MLEDALTRRVVFTRGTRVETTLDAELARRTRDTLSRTLYLRLVERVLASVNQSLLPGAGGVERSVSVYGGVDSPRSLAATMSHTSIALLDAVATAGGDGASGVEQLFAYYANEKLQVRA